MFDKSAAQCRARAAEFRVLRKEALETPRADFDRVLFVSRCDADIRYWDEQAEEAER